MTKRLEAKSWPVEIVGNPVSEGEEVYMMIRWNRAYTKALKQWRRRMLAMGAKNVRLVLAVDFKDEKRR